MGQHDPFLGERSRAPRSDPGSLQLTEHLVILYQVYPPPRWAHSKHPGSTASSCCWAFRKTSGKSRNLAHYVYFWAIFPRVAQFVGSLLHLPGASSSPSLQSWVLWAGSGEQPAYGAKFNGSIYSTIIFYYYSFMPLFIHAFFFFFYSFK